MASRGASTALTTCQRRFGCPVMRIQLLNGPSNFQFCRGSVKYLLHAAPSHQPLPLGNVALESGCSSFIGASVQLWALSRTPLRVRKCWTLAGHSSNKGEYGQWMQDGFEVLPGLEAIARKLVEEKLAGEIFEAPVEPEASIFPSRNYARAKEKE